MKKISDLLQEYLKTKNINISEAARICNIDRANMHKIFYGKRNLSSSNVARSLVKYLQLTPQEEAEFIESYYYSLEGYDYKKRRDVDEFFTRIDNSVMYNRIDLPQIHYDDDPAVPLPDISSVTSLQNVHYTAMWVLLKEFAKPNPIVRLVSAAEEQDMLTSMLKSCAVENYSPEIQHVFSLAGRIQDNKNNDNYNFQCFMTVFALCVESGDYQPFYYYTLENNSKNNAFPMFPYFMATSEYLMLFSKDYLHALLISEKNVLKAELRKFDSYVKKSKVFLNISKSPITQTSVVHDFLTENQSIYVFNMKPSMVILLTEEMIKKSVNINLRNLPEINNYAGNYFSSDIKLFNENAEKFLLSVDGVKSFLENGRFNEIPEDDYNPLPLEERKTLIQKYIDNLADRTILLYHDIYENSGCITYLAGEKNCLLYYKGKDNGLCSLLISEISIQTVFRDYIDSISPDKYYPPGETAEQLQRILDEFEGK